MMASGKAGRDLRDSKSSVQVHRTAQSIKWVAKLMNLVCLSLMHVVCPCAADAVAVKAAANVSFSYNAPAFLILRIGLLAGHPVEARELIALEAGVQKVSTSSC